MVRFLIGSSYFFSSYTNYRITDYDYLELYEEHESHIGHHKFRRYDYIRFSIYDRDSALRFISEHDQPVVIGKFLVPEVCSYLGITIEDLPLLKKFIPNLDRRHLYLKIIYESYLKNGSFTLTDEQRDRAFKVYREARYKKGVISYARK